MAAAPVHASCSAWFAALSEFALCPITELGFLRVSMSPAFRASYEGAAQVIDTLKARPGATHIPCDAAVRQMPMVSSYKDTTDAYLVHLAEHHSYRFATLDEGILNKSWASGVAYNPIATWGPRKNKLAHLLEPILASAKARERSIA